MSNYRNNNIRSKSPPLVKTNLDDWETDPDFVNNMDEMDQRWGGTKRTVGSINMNQLLDEVRKDHKTMREKLNHPSQRDYSAGFGGKFGIQHDRKDQSALDYDHHESLSKHSSQEIKRELITSTSSSIIRETGSSLVNEAKKSFLEQASSTYQKGSPAGERISPSTQKPKVGAKTFLSSNQPNPQTGNNSNSPTSPPPPASRFEETKRIFKEEKSSSTSSISSSNARPKADLPPAFKSIQEKFEAYKREFEDIENKVAKKLDMSKVIKKTTTNFEKSNVEYVSRNPSEVSTSVKSESSINKPVYKSTINSAPESIPKATTIKSLSERFETLGRDDSEDFKRRTELKRKEFFDQIKNQVRETRKELDGFDPIDEDEPPERPSSQQRTYSPGSRAGVANQRFAPSPTSPQSSSRPSSWLTGSDLQGSTSSLRPKVYTKRETTEERIVSKIVKENDKIIEDETKRDVKRSSSCHGSSDEDENVQAALGRPTSIKVIEQNLRASPVQEVRTESPIERLKRQHPLREPEVKGAGLMARTLYDYQANEPDELSFDVDDLITNIEKVDPGWYKGIISYKNGKKQEGLFPANYVKLLNDNDGEY